MAIILSLDTLTGTSESRMATSMVETVACKVDDMKDGE